MPSGQQTISTEKQATMDTVFFEERQQLEQTASVGYRPYVSPEGQIASYILRISPSILTEPKPQASVADIVQSVLEPPPRFFRLLGRRPTSPFVLLQKWEGIVLELSRDSFVARLTDLFGSSTEEEAEIAFEEIDPQDRELVRPGAVFYWSIGYDDKASGRERVSLIRFRRLPTWTEEELGWVRREAEEIGKDLDWR